MDDLATPRVAHPPAPDRERIRAEVERTLARAGEIAAIRNEQPPTRYLDVLAYLVEHDRTLPTGMWPVERPTDRIVRPVGDLPAQVVTPTEDERPNSEQFDDALRRRERGDEPMTVKEYESLAAEVDDAYASHEALVARMQADEWEGYDGALRYDHPFDVEERWPLMHAINLSAAWDDDTTPEYLVPEMLVRLNHHTCFGEPEAGKTMFALAALVAPVLRDGGIVIYVDKEMNRREILDRLKTLDLPRVLVEDRFVYLELPVLDGSKPSREQWAELLAAEQPDLVVVDAQAGVLADAGLSEDKTADVLGWHAAYLEPARRAGATTVMLDHVGHKEKGRERGASGKRANAKLSYLLERVSSFGREQVGQVRLTKTKDNLSTGITKERVFDIGGGPEGFVFERSADLFHVIEEAKDDYRSRVEQAILEAGEDGLTTVTLAKVVGGNKSQVTNAAKLLVLDPSSRVRVRSGDRGANVYYVEPETEQVT